MNNHKVQELVNHLCEIANKFAGKEQLHDRIAIQVMSFLNHQSHTNNEQEDLQLKFVFD